MRELIAATILFIALNILDVLTTHAALAAGMAEMNVLSVVQNLHGEMGMYLIKAMLITASISIVWLLDKRLNQRLRLFLWMSCAGYFLVVGWNLYNLGVI